MVKDLSQLAVKILWDTEFLVTPPTPNYGQAGKMHRIRSSLSNRQTPQLNRVKASLERSRFAGWVLLDKLTQIGAIKSAASRKADDPYFYLIDSWMSSAYLYAFLTDKPHFLATTAANLMNILR